MKKIALFAMAAAVCAVLATPASAQSSSARNEINVTGGALTMYDCVIMGFGTFATGITNGSSSYDNYQPYGSIGVEWFHFLGENGTCKIGLIGTIAAGSYDELVAGMKNDRAYYAAIGAMPAFKVMWFQHPKFAMYSKIAAGAAWLSGFEEDNDGNTNEYSNQIGFTFQASPVGMEFGGAKVRGFLEGGIGIQGTLVGGVRIRL